MTGLIHVWWAWLSAAFILAILEVLVPGYIFLGFALGAAAMAILILFGAGGLSVPWLLVIFALLSLLAYVLLRHFFKLSRGQVKTWDTDIND